MDAIKEKFGSLEAMMKEFKAASQGVEGSGWGILGVDPMSKTLVICGAEKHQNLEIPRSRPHPRLRRLGTRLLPEAPEPPGGLY